MRFKKPFVCVLVALVALSLPFASCKKKENAPVTITLAAAASLKNVFETQIIPQWEAAHPDIKIQGIYDSSGRLQNQIENGLAADIFFSAATKQMDALVSESYINKDDVIPFLQNKLVLIKNKDETTAVTGFDNITDAKTIAIGDPKVVPAGQYAMALFTKAGDADAVLKKASLGSNVTEVLSWTAAGSAEVGVVYATDAAQSSDVTIIAEANDENPPVYPIAVTAKSEHKKEAAEFEKYLTQQCLPLFEAAGFSKYQGAAAGQ